MYPSDSARAGGVKIPRSLPPGSYLPLVRGRRLRKEASFNAAWYCDVGFLQGAEIFFRTLPWKAAR